MGLNRKSKIANNLTKEESISNNEILLSKEFYKLIKYLDKGEFQEGSEFANKVIVKCQEREDRLGEIDAILGKVENIICLSLFKESIELIEEGNSLLKEIQHFDPNELKLRKAYLKFLKGRIYAERFEMYPAIKLFEESYQLRKEINDKVGMMWSLLNWGTSTISIGNFKNGEIYLNKSLSLAEEIDVELGIIWSLINLSGVQYHLRDLDKAIFYAEKCLEIGEPKVYRHSNSMCYYLIGSCLYEKGDLDKAVLYFEKNLDNRLETGYKNLIAQSYYSIGNVYSQKGELKRSLEYYKKIIMMPEVRNDQILKPAYYTTIGKIYGELGDFSKANDYLLKALKLFEKRKIYIFHYLNCNLSITRTLHYLIVLLVNSEKLEKANEYLKKLNEIYKENPDFSQYEQLYYLDKAIILKSSNRLMDKMEAGLILKKLVKEKIIDHEITIEAMTNLCELLIYELELSANKKILQEIKELSDKLLVISKSKFLYNLLAETYFFKAKIALINLEINKARLLLIKAQNTAKIYGLRRLANKISNEHDHLLSHLDKWKEIAEDNIPLEKRVKHARHEFLFSKMLRTKIEEFPTIEDNPVYLVIMYPHNGRCLYSRTFQDIGINDDDLITSFISAINIFGKEAFSNSGSIDRIKHGEYLIIIKSHDIFSFGYVFKGHSYLAINKLDNFIETISLLTNIAESLIMSVKTFLDISEESRLTIDQIVDNIFLSGNNS